ncbi:MAG: hypothetical protein ABIH19_03655, partial [Candidatus Omnitrophota bacterium]
MATLKDNIIELLIKSNHLDKNQLDKALEIQKKRGTPLRKILVEQGLISEETLLSLLSEQLYIPTLHLTKYKFDPNVINLVPERMARQYSLIPLSKMGNTLTVAMSDPLNIFALDDVRALTGCNVDTVLSPEEEILRVIDIQFGGGTQDIQHAIDEASLQEKGEGLSVELKRD